MALVTAQATPPPQSCPTRCARSTPAASSSATTSADSSRSAYAARPPAARRGSIPRWSGARVRSPAACSVRHDLVPRGRVLGEAVQQDDDVAVARARGRGRRRRARRARTRCRTRLTDTRPAGAEGTARRNAGAARPLPANAAATGSATAPPCPPAHAARSPSPPNPPPVIRAPSAPAAVAASQATSSSTRRDLVVVAQRGVRGVEQRADPGEVAGVDQLDRLPDALDLRDDVPHPAGDLVGLLRVVDGIAEPLSAAVERRRRDLAQPPHAEQGRGPLALLAARPVLAVGERVVGAGVDDEQLQAGRGEVERHVPHAEVAAVDEQRRPRPRAQRRRLVHARRWARRRCRSRRARRRRRAGARPLVVRPARARRRRRAPPPTAHSRAADEDSPAPSGTSPSTTASRPGDRVPRLPQRPRDADGVGRPAVDGARRDVGRATLPAGPALAAVGVRNLRASRSTPVVVARATARRRCGAAARTAGTGRRCSRRAHRSR